MRHTLLFLICALVPAPDGLAQTSASNHAPRAVVDVGAGLGITWDDEGLLGREVGVSAGVGTNVTPGAAEPAVAQDNPAPIVEAVIGRSGFIDEVWDHFTTIGGGARTFVTPRLAIGPEVAFLRGEFDARDASNLMVTGNITFDCVRDDRRARFVPYLAAGGGYLRQKTVVGSGPGSTTVRPFTSSEGTVSGGAGVRIGVTSRVFVAPEFRLGWEPETRFAVMIGMRTR